MTASLLIPPGLVLIIGGLLLPFLRGGLRSIVVIALPLVTLALVWNVPDGTVLQAPFLGYDLILVKGDKLSRLFATIFAIMAFAGGLFALNQARTDRAGRCLRLCRQRHRRRLRRRSHHPVHLLGGDGHWLDAGRVVRRAGGPRRRAPLCLHPPVGRRIAYGGHRRRGCRHRVDRLRKLGHEHRSALADPGWVSDQRRRARHCRLGCRMPIPSPPGRAWCSCRPSRPRRRSTCCCAAFQARSC